MTERKNRPSDLDEAVERRRARQDAWRRSGERPLARNLAMVGTLGWLIVLPALVGTLIGRWIDRKSGSGVTFTSAMMLLGIVGGSWLAWKKVRAA
jgi:ATP synthase protein I